MLKVTVLGAVYGVLASVIDVAWSISALAAGCAGVGYIAVKVMWPVVGMVRRAASAYDVLEELPDTVRSFKDTLVGHDRRLTGLEAEASQNGNMLRGITRELGIEHRRIDDPRGIEDFPEQQSDW